MISLSSLLNIAIMFHHQKNNVNPDGPQSFILKIYQLFKDFLKLSFLKRVFMPNKDRERKESHWATHEYLHIILWKEFSVSLRQEIENLNDFQKYLEIL